ncbi:nitrate- and nitrite sensing domain-containing protein [Marinoscillum sp. MHG1-6]|uniref:nitrate- and nitrite sensing domain-containing protein n=1 Tax=Marinoscillum sp. MHG1-6 TaxID=2959627 RepID=UPI0021585F78|nr:nitrate- and nitrite sensing domain-containing protein [Marinoscillum sp. MHG1-6]
MKILYDLPIRIKFAVVLIPLIVIIICFDYLQIRHNYLDYNDSERLNITLKLGVEINQAVHELQKERSIAIGYTSSEGIKFLEELKKQRSISDAALNKFYTELGKPETSEVTIRHNDELKLLQSKFESLKGIRGKIDKRSLQSSQILNYYSEINNIALNTVDLLINETRDKEIAQQVHALIYFLKAKEEASIERAIGTQALSSKEMNDELYSAFTSLVAKEQSYIDAFLVIADAESQGSYSREISGHDVEEVDRLRNIIHLRTTFDVEPSYWYDMTTSKINSLKKVEDQISERLLSRTVDLSSSAFRKFWSFVIVDIVIGAMAMWLMSIIVSNLLANVKTLEKFTLRISQGDWSSKVSIPTKDEIGQYAKTFNVMVDEINASHDILRKERDKAKFLYHNIYRVSMLVFKNIHQGIFLLDRNFKMSKLYSKAMEKIFGVNKIAGENFSNFMRPLIIPRDLEALEMFMRHLFNEDMDEDVVNQLNPIEQVKIFNEINGVVTTKYIRVNFTRIWGKNRIVNVMVTVSDETESVLLQKHLEEAEKQKKQETEQVLSILKIDPSVIRGFLYNSKKTLKSISERYESDKESDLKMLLDFTFQTIHSLKANAVVIGLEIMSEKFHSIEETIEKLKAKEVTGKDFLTVLYEIDDADKMIDDMNSMLRKVADVYRKYPSGGSVASNIMLVDSLERSVKVLSDKMDKPVDFFFKNEENLVLSGEQVEQCKDIMLQLIRNSIKHGIEDREVRLKQGKLLRGNINVELEHPKKNTLQIVYKDDGKGLDVSEIKDKAVKKGLITDYEAKKMTDKKAVNLIFENGFSTSDKVDEHAGRGQGMSLVKSLIEELKAKFKMDYEAGKYFKLVISLPFKDDAGKIEENEAIDS